jgi:hypothetical protein
MLGRNSRLGGKELGVGREPKPLCQADWHSKSVFAISKIDDCGPIMSPLIS